MEIIILDHSNDVATMAADIIAELITLKSNACLGLATGSTPVATYTALIRLHRSMALSFAEVCTFNLDEYLGIVEGSPQSYKTFMWDNLFRKIDIAIENTHFPTCENGSNPAQSGENYESIINKLGGIDLQILGIGTNGHIGFNEPSSSLSSRTRVKTLTQSTIADNSRLFSEGEFQPHLAMTMGIATILDARKILLLATGQHKAKAVAAAIEGPLTGMCPASALQLHPDAVLILDQAAASKLNNSEYYRWAQSENLPLKNIFGHFPQLR